MEIGLSLSLTSNKGVGYCSEANALFARFTTPPTAQRKTQINTLIVALKTAGVWAKLDVLDVLAAADAQAARQNWIADRYNAAAVSSPTFTADRGYTTDGAASHLDLNFNPTTASSPLFVQNDAYVGLWSRTSGPMASSGFFFDGTDGVTLNTRTAGNLMTWRINQRFADVTAAVVTDGSGWFSATRSSSTATRASRNGSQLATSPSESAALNNNTLYLGRSTASSYVAVSVSAVAIGKFLTTAEDAALSAALLVYLQGVGAA